MNKHLHIVCLDVPYPPDYGGVSDLYYKIVALHAEGILIHLHCFEYGRSRQKELDKYCTEVNYYPRKGILKSFSLSIPYIVNSRRNKVLLKNLLTDNHPILFEGIHCTYFIFHPQLANRKVVVRLHNVEYKYYQNLARSESSFYKKLYFLFESSLLKRYEKKVGAIANCVAVTNLDKEIYIKDLYAKSVKFLPVFIANKKVKSKTGYGDYCLYHGNLSVNENEKVVLWLVSAVFNSLEVPFVIAGKNPSKALLQAASANKNIRVEVNPSPKKMAELIEKAQVNILPSGSSAGVKIKLLNAVFNGRHCVVNNNTVIGTGLEEVCYIAETPQEFITAFKNVYKTPFTEKDILERENILAKFYNNEENARRLIHLLY